MEMNGEWHPQTGQSPVETGTGWKNTNASRKLPSASLLTCGDYLMPDAYTRGKKVMYYILAKVKMY